MTILAKFEEKMPKIVEYETNVEQMFDKSELMFNDVLTNVKSATIK